MSRDRFVGELGRFCDLDSEPTCIEDGADLLLSFHQRGELVQLRIDQRGGRVVETREGQDYTHRTYFGLLASKNFGDLRRLVDAQRALLTRDAPYIRDVENHLPVVGEFESPTVEDVWIGSGLLDTSDQWLAAEPNAPNQIRSLIIDGPAGIGKTHLIRRLVFDRIRRFGPGSAPPILHVQSRGRKLTTLSDVIAGTLQSLRLTLTFDQVPVLARHGLLQVAIDGFDELADPNGYETAWGSVRDFLDDIAGKGGIILAGRETFIDAGSVRKALPKLDTPATAAAHLRHLTPMEAHNWLSKQGWSVERLDALEDAGILEDGSYALRPFFISQIVKVSLGHEFDKFISFPLQALVTQIISREADILSSHIHKLSNSDFHKRLFTFYEEVSREMADGEVDHIDQSALSLLAEIVFSQDLNPEEMSMLHHRVKALALMEQDVVTDRRRFPHTEIQDFFLSSSYLRNIVSGEAPKSLRRNIIGQDTLETFFDVTSSRSPSDVHNFLTAADERLRRRDLEERGRKNLAALCLCAISAKGEKSPTLKLSDISLDEAILRGTVASCSMVAVDFAQLDVRGADLTKVEFADCRVGALVGDATTRLPKNFPKPGILFVEEKGRRKQLFDPRLHEDWLQKHSLRRPTKHNDARYPKDHETLFNKICRVIIRQNWIRLNEDDRAGRLLDDPLWNHLRAVLEAENFLMSRSLAAQGPRSEFVRIRRARDLLDPSNSDPEIMRVRERIAMLDNP